MIKLCKWTIVAASFFSLNAQAISGNDWNSWNQSGKDAYVAGVIDTWGAAETYRKSELPSIPENTFTLLTNCAKAGMTYPQFDAIVRTWMDENPSEWHQSMTFLVLEAMAKACRLKKVEP